MNPTTKQNINMAFSRIKTAYESTQLPIAKEYYVTLGNVNEVYLMKKDATKSIFLGRLFDKEDATIESEGRKIFDVLTTYFRSIVDTPITNVPEVENKPVEKKTTRRTKKVVETSVVEEVPEVSEDFASDDDTSWIDSIQ